MARSTLSLLALFGPLVIGCGGDKGDGDSGTDDTDGTGTSSATGSTATGATGTGTGSTSGPEPTDIDVLCLDALDDVWADPGTLPAEPGAIIKCHTAEAISKADLQAAAEAYDDYEGEDFTSGAKVYKVLYRTERGNGDPGYTSAFLYVPDTPRAAELPVVVASHGSRGQAPQCAPTREHADGEYVHEDFIRQVYPMVGSGLAVIAPDLAGYANYGAAGNPPSAYNDAADVGRSTLDGVRAMRNLVGDELSLTDDVVIVGHSAGGQTALASAALWDTYNPGGNLVGVVAYSPLWVSQTSWGALFAVAKDYPFDEVPSVGAVSIWYHYTKSALLDGDGTKLFRKEKKAAIKEWVDNQCWAASYPGLEALGDTVTDVFDPNYISAIQLPAAFGWDCSGNALCETWMERFKADRPHLTGTSATVPILIVYGMSDTSIDPGRMACVAERLMQDDVNVEYCIEDDKDHSTIVGSKSWHVSEWIAARTLGGTDPGACSSGEETFIDNGSMVISCTTPPPND